MVEIRQLWSTMQKMFPDKLRTQATLAKTIRIIDPAHLTAKRASEGILITGKIWIKLPRKAPKTITMKVTVTELTLDDKTDVDLALFKSKDPEAAMGEIIKSLFLCSLISLGIFNVPVKREAFRAMTKLHSASQGE